MDLTWLANYPALTVAANLAGVVGFALAFFFYFRGKERFALSYSVVERQLIQPSMTRPFDMDVPLSWNGKQVSRLTRTFILVTNTGNKLLERDDVVFSPSIRVLENSEIIDAELAFADDPGSQILVVGGPGQACPFSFEFLRPKDSFILKIDHTGALNELFLECRTKAGGPIKKVNQVITAIVWATVCIPVVGFIGYGIWPYVNLPEPFAYQSPYTGAFETVMAVLLLGVAFVLSLLGVAFLISLPFSYALLRTGKKPVKKSWIIFMDITNNTKGALS